MSDLPPTTVDLGTSSPMSTFEIEFTVNPCGREGMLDKSCDLEQEGNHISPRKTPEQDLKIKKNVYVHYFRLFVLSTHVVSMILVLVSVERPPSCCGDTASNEILYIYGVLGLIFALIHLLDALLRGETLFLYVWALPYSIISVSLLSTNGEGNMMSTPSLVSMSIGSILSLLGNIRVTCCPGGYIAERTFRPVCCQGWDQGKLKDRNCSFVCMKQWSRFNIGCVSIVHILLLLGTAISALTYLFLRNDFKYNRFSGDAWEFESTPTNCSAFYSYSSSYVTNYGRGGTIDEYCVNFKWSPENDYQDHCCIWYLNALD
jgi:hypothetical protein